MGHGAAGSSAEGGDGCVGLAGRWMCQRFTTENVPSMGIKSLYDDGCI